MKRFWIYIVVALVVAVLWGQSAFYTVDQAEFAYVTRFGEPIHVFDGATAAGLHVKWPAPIESVRRIDRRLQVIDLPPTEPLTRDAIDKEVDKEVGKTLTVDAFVCWQIPDADAADRFLRTVGTVEQARRLLTPRINGRLTAVISNVPVSDLFGLADNAQIESRSQTVRRKLLGLERLGPNDTDQPLADTVLHDYGIQIVDIRLRRLNYPEAALPSIIESISERLKEKVTKIETEGSQHYTKIVEDAKYEASKIEKRAATEKKIIQEKADLEAGEIRLKADSIDPDFARFWRKIKALQVSLSKSNDVLLLSGKHPLFDLMLRPPHEEKRK
jgi:modulator of FtsH protease HflC